MVENLMFTGTTSRKHPFTHIFSGIQWWSLQALAQMVDKLAPADFQFVIASSSSSRLLLLMRWWTGFRYSALSISSECTSELIVDVKSSQTIWQWSALSDFAETPVFATKTVNTIKPLRIFLFHIKLSPFLSIVLSYNFSFCLMLDKPINDLTETYLHIHFQWFS